MSKTSKIVTLSFDCFGLSPCGHPGDKRRIIKTDGELAVGDEVQCPQCRDIDSAYQAGINDTINKAAGLTLGASGDGMSNQREFTSEHVFVDQDGRVHFQSDKFPHLPPDWVALSLDNMEDRKALAERFAAIDNQFTRDLKEVLDDKEE